MSKEFWNERYRLNEYVYGETPNVYFAEKLEKIPKGKILLPCEGEGRNGVYAAQKGFTVFGFDQSEVAKEKAIRLANKFGVNIYYDVCEAENINYTQESFDALGLIFAHFPLDKQVEYHKKFFSFLKSNAYVILEGFHKKHLEYQKLYPNVGGPREESMLYELEFFERNFPNLKILEGEEKEVELHEGNFHVGKAYVVRLFGLVS